MHKKKLGYYAICEPSKSPGVFKKITGFVNAAKALGWRANTRLIKSGHFSHFSLAWQVATAPEDLLIIRGNSYGLVVLTAGLLLARLRRKKTIIDVATPSTSVITEITSGPGSLFRKSIKIIGLLLSGPWSLWPAHRIIQYAPESSWFSFGLTRKIMLIGNGIDSNSIPLRKIYPEWPSNNLKLIGVGQIAAWHGYDLIIKALSDFNKGNDRRFDVYFTVVGTGPELDNLKKLSRQLEVEEYITFTGHLEGQKLYEQYERAHIAVGSLALHRKGINFASELKAREYSAVGIPFLSSGQDPDFDEGGFFRYTIEEKEEITSIIDFFHSMNDDTNFPTPASIRNFCEKNLDFTVKIPKIVNI